MTDKIKTLSSRVEPSVDGKFIAFWRGRVVFENGRVKRCLAVFGMSASYAIVR